MTRLSDKRIGKLIGVSRETVDNWSTGGRISDSRRQRLLAVLDVLERARKHHPTPDQLGAWLDTPRGTRGRTPAELLEAGEIDRARYFAVATPSPRLRVPPSWVGLSVSGGFPAGAERRQEAMPPDEDHELFQRFGAPGGDDDEDVANLAGR